MTQAQAPALLARGPWAAEQVRAVWRDEAFVAEGAQGRRRRRRDRRAARPRLAQPRRRRRAAGRLSTDADGALRARAAAAALGAAPRRGRRVASRWPRCASRATAEGRWLAGRRAAWLSSWAGRWALGAGGAVDVGESPFDTLTRELREEWSVERRARAGRGARAPAAPPHHVHRAGLAARGRRGHARPRARRLRLVARGRRRLAAPRPTTPLRRMARAADAATR